MQITHQFIKDFGWENTIYQPSDFKEIEKLGENKEGTIYLGVSENGKRYILRDDSHTTN